MIPRRVVTGHGEHGRPVFALDGEPPVIRTAPDGAMFCEIWATDAAPAPIAATEPDPTRRSLTVPPSSCGTKIRINEFPPGLISPTHRTESVDYGIVLDGEITLVLAGSEPHSTETVLRPGDVVVQRGTSHRWENRSARPARMAFVLVDGAFTADLRAALGQITLLDDPL
jgi:quercetin dioxygenase-like cupin family protein